jgi:cellobiose phosphorylase
MSDATPPPFGFTADNAFEIRDPRLPGAWWNYLFNDRTHVTVGPDGSGRSITRDPVIQQWNRPFRWLYVRDRSTGAVWCPGHAPLGSAIQDYRCTHGPASTVITGGSGGIGSRLRVFVPTDPPAEVWTWEITEGSNIARDLDAFVVLGLDDRNFMGWRSAWDAGHGVFHKYAFPHHAHYEDYERLRSHPTHAVIAPSIPPFSWAGRLEDVNGGRCAGEIPCAVADGRLPSAAVSNGDPVAALHWRVALPPGRTWRVDWVAGLFHSTEEGSRWRDALAATPDAVEAAHAAAVRASAGDEGRLVLRSPDPDLDRHIHRWTKKQITWQTRLWRNAVSFPVRNILQDAAGYSLYAPEPAWEAVRAVLEMQRADGNLKVWTTRKGERADHPLVHKVHDDGGIWLAICAEIAIRNGADPARLAEKVGWSDGGEADVLEHLVQGLRFYDAEIGAHGLVLMRDGDWTDPMNGPGRHGRGESGWASMALAHACGAVAELAGFRGDTGTVEELQTRRTRLIAAIDAHLWAGDRYAYGFDDDGRRFGDASDGRTFLNVQTWALLAGCGDSVRRTACVAAIDRLGTPFGPRLLAPPFPGWDPQAGRLSIKIPGFGENGSVYCHGSAFAAAAFGAVGDADRCLDVIRRTLPTNPDHPPSRSRQIPIWQPNAYFGDLDAADAGHSTGALGTGTCTWILMTVCELLSGMRVELDGIGLGPALLPSGWDSFELERDIRGARYRLVVRRDGGPGVRVDGRPFSGQRIPFAREGCECLIERGPATGGHP